jgi:hypothetical protein
MKEKCFITLMIGANIIKLFFFVIGKCHNKLDCSFLTCFNMAMSIFAIEERNLFIGLSTLLPYSQTID